MAGAIRRDSEKQQESYTREDGRGLCTVEDGCGHVPRPGGAHARSARDARQGQKVGPARACSEAQDGPRSPRSVGERLRQKAQAHGRRGGAGGEQGGGRPLAIHTLHGCDGAGPLQAVFALCAAPRQCCDTCGSAARARVGLVAAPQPSRNCRQVHGSVLRAAPLCGRPARLLAPSVPCLDFPHRTISWHRDKWSHGRTPGHCAGAASVGGGGGGAPQHSQLFRHQPGGGRIAAGHAQLRRLCQGPLGQFPL